MKEKIYLIPGLMTDHRIWEKLESYLDEYELIHLPIPLSDNFDEIIEMLEKTIKCEKINLLGFSLGGYIASYFAIKYPLRVHKLFLLGSTPSATEPKDINKRQSRLNDAKKNEFKTLKLDKAKELLEIDDEINANTMVNMFNDLGENIFISQLQSTLNRVDLFPSLLKLNFPIKLFYSENDRLFNHDSIENIMKIEHKLEIVSRVGSSHNISLEIPEVLSMQIKSWMN